MPYRARGAQASLPLHSDQSILSFTIALNDPAEYEGGGTWFRALGMALDAPRAGHAVIFPGRLEHAGHGISRGVRYVIVLFVGADDNRSGRPPGWVLSQLDARREAEDGAQVCRCICANGAGGGPGRQGREKDGKVL